MSQPLMITDLDEQIEQRLLARATRNKRSMEGEIKEVLAEVLREPDQIPDRTEKLKNIRGIWKGRTTTDQFMELMRGG